jgi:hypothetical protein
MLQQELVGQLDRELPEEELEQPRPGEPELEQESAELGREPALALELEELGFSLMKSA